MPWCTQKCLTMPTLLEMGDVCSVSDLRIPAERFQGPLGPGSGYCYEIITEVISTVECLHLGLPELSLGFGSCPQPHRGFYGNCINGIWGTSVWGRVHNADYRGPGVSGIFGGDVGIPA